MNTKLASCARTGALPLLLLSLFAASLACNTLTNGIPAASQTQELVVKKDITFGPGHFNYGDTTTGLADLSSYTATLTITFDGTKDGKPEKWSRAYKMLSTKNPPARLWTIDKTENDVSADTIIQAEMSGLDYKKDGKDSCRANTIQTDEPLSKRLELASFLSGVIGAQEAGSDTVNKIAATHYTFDQHALGEDGISQSTGEIWVATAGNYLVKYVLTTKAGSKYFSPGVEGTLRMNYELSGPNAKVKIDLPKDCPPGLITVPAMPDATNVQNFPGMQVYTSASSIADVVAFYKKELPPLGWKPEGDPAITDKAGNVNFTQGDQAMVISIEPAGSGSTVTIFVGQNQSLP